MAGANFESLLKKSIGLDAASIGVSAIERAVQQRQAACHLQRREAYWEHVRSSKAELQALIEAVVVPETWFFRDPEAFAALGRHVIDHCLQSRPDAIARVLSLPCSTGEEPYSMTMALLDAGIPGSRFRVDAVDISERALAVARTGVYRRTSFRGQHLEYRERHFDATEHGHRIRDHVRRHVDLRHGNLLVPSTLPGKGMYDAVFCRNVLIYFDRDGQARAIESLAGLLAPGGLLFVGPAEASLLLNQAFVSARFPKAHAFRRAQDGAAELPVARPQRAHRPVFIPPPRKVAAADATRQVSRTAPRPVPVEPPVAPPIDPDLDAGLRLANEGRFAEAAECCDLHMRRHGPSAQAFYLLGLVHDAAGRELDASGCYKKALYLDPYHHDALVHLALLMDRQCNKAEADRLRVRARRAARPEGAS